MKLYAYVRNGSYSKSMQKDGSKLEECADKLQIRFNATRCKMMYTGKDNTKLLMQYLKFMGTLFGIQHKHITQIEKM